MRGNPSGNIVPECEPRKGVNWRLSELYAQTSATIRGNSDTSSLVLGLILYTKVPGVAQVGIKRINGRQLAAALSPFPPFILPWVLRPYVCVLCRHKGGDFDSLSWRDSGRLSRNCLLDDPNWRDFTSAKSKSKNPPCRKERDKDGAPRCTVFADRSVRATRAILL